MVIRGLTIAIASDAESKAPNVGNSLKGKWERSAIGSLRQIAGRLPQLPGLPQEPQVVPGLPRVGNPISEPTTLSTLDNMHSGPASSCFLRKPNLRNGGFWQQLISAKFLFQRPREEHPISKPPPTRMYILERVLTEPAPSGQMWSVNLSTATNSVAPYRYLPRGREGEPSPFASAVTGSDWT